MKNEIVELLKLKDYRYINKKEFDMDVAEIKNKIRNLNDRFSILYDEFGKKQSDIFKELIAIQKQCPHPPDAIHKKDATGDIRIPVKFDVCTLCGAELTMKKIIQS